MKPRASNAVLARGFIHAVWLTGWLAGIGITTLNRPVVAADELRTIRTIAGTGNDSDNGRDGPASETNVGQPFGVEFGPGGGLYITEVANHRIWRLDMSTRRMSIVAGNGKLGYDAGVRRGIDAPMNEPYEVRFDANGNMYEVEMQNHIVRRIGTDGSITTIAGIGEAGFSGDGGAATQARLKVPHGIVLDGKGYLYIADIGNHRVRRLDLESGVIDTMAGTGAVTPPRNGDLARESALPGPRALATDGESLWVALREGHSLWRIDLATNRLHHVGGTGKAGYSGDGGPASEATFNGPKGLAVDKRRNLFIVDSENDVIRVIDSRSRIVSTIAGTAKTRGFGGDSGSALKAKLSQPHGICLDELGNVYVGDTRNHRVRVVSARE